MKKNELINGIRRKVENFLDKTKKKITKTTNVGNLRRTVVEYEDLIKDSE